MQDKIIQIVMDKKYIVGLSQQGNIYFLNPNDFADPDEDDAEWHLLKRSPELLGEAHE